MLYFIIVIKTDGPKYKSNKRHGVVSAVRKRKAELNHEDIYCLLKKMFEDSLFWQLNTSILLWDLCAGFAWPSGLASWAHDL